MSQKHLHKFHIPVLGTGFSIDTPIKVSKYGISSVISLVDDILMEKLRKHYCEKGNLQYDPINEKEHDSRARRITAYLNLVNKLAKEQFEILRNSKFTAGSEISRYYEMLPDTSPLKIKYNEMSNTENSEVKNDLQKWLRSKIYPGSIDVNIMTKVDKQNYSSEGIPLSTEYNDAHAALRGYALSELAGSIIFSAGMNPRLYGYMESFTDFLPDRFGNFKKKIIIKVSDFRSALIQGKFLANKGLWVSEFRIESGLNCGGHAFATNGYLLGPILDEFFTRKEELLNSMSGLYKKSLNKKNIVLDNDYLNIDITAQGGVGKSSEQEFLIRRYGIKSVGWGSPFLLVPEVINVDDFTLQKLSEAGENDIYLSNVSPLGVPFNNLRGSSQEIEKLERIKNGKPGSPCPKKFLISNNDYSKKLLCTASISYLNKKKTDLNEKLTGENKTESEFEKAAEKVCLCEGLSSSALTANNLNESKFSSAVSVCPGPNLAYYSKISGLKDMVDHIYGKINLITDPQRPNMFIKETSLYIDFLIKKIEENLKPYSAKTEEYLRSFHKNLSDGIEYYKNLIPEILEETEKVKQKIIGDLDLLEKRLLSISIYNPFENALLQE